MGDCSTVRGTVETPVVESGKSKNQSIGKGKQEIMDLKTLYKYRIFLHNFPSSNSFWKRQFQQTPRVTRAYPVRLKDDLFIKGFLLCGVFEGLGAPKVREKLTDDLWVRPWSIYRIYLFGRSIIMFFSTFQDTVSDNDV
jgi:hypothetical protein